MGSVCRHRAAAGLTVLALVAACTTSNSGHQEPSTSSSTNRPSVSTDGKQLSCPDSASSATGPDTQAKQLAPNLTVEDWATPADVPRARAVGLIIPPGAPEFFRKSPLYLREGAPATTLSLTQDQDAQLAWVPSRVWTKGKPNLSPWLTHSLTLTPCKNTASTFLGGILSTSPTSCIVITIKSVGMPTTTTSLRLDGKRCRS